MCRCVVTDENEILQIHQAYWKLTDTQCRVYLAIPDSHQVLSRQRKFHCNPQELLLRVCEALMFLLIWYSVSTTLFQMIRSKIFISDCVVFFDTIETFTQTIAGWVVLTGKNMAQISDGISNPVIAGIIYWLIRILVCGGCMVGAGILVAFIGIKIARLYKKYCWDIITILVTFISMAIAIYFGDWIKTVLPFDRLFFLLLVQVIYVGIRWYVKGWRETRGYY